MKIAIIIMVTVVLLLTGCATPSIVTVIPKEELVTRFIPISNVPKIYTDRTVDTDGVFPPEVVIGNVNYGDELSAWTVNIPELGIKKGETSALYIFNRTLEDITYNISYSQPVEILRDDDGNEYVSAIASVFWVELSDKLVIVPPETVAAISVRIIVPEKTKEFSLPDRWAFQLRISPVQGGNIQRAYLQNWLIGMR